jgi:hypothetical protein
MKQQANVGNGRTGIRAFRPGGLGEFPHGFGVCLYFGMNNEKNPSDISAA